METNAAPFSGDTAPAAEPIVLGGGESPASWDELESITVRPKQEPKSEPKSEPKESTKKAKEDKPEEKEEKVEASKGKEAKALEKSDAPAKLYKLRSGETEFDVAADALVPVKVDGKVVEVPLQEAINRYSQQSHLDKLYKTYKAEKEGFEKERKGISEALNKSYDYLVNQKDLRGFLDYLGEAMGVDSQTLYQDAIGNIQKQIEEYQTMSPEERKFREVEAENAYYKKRMDTQKQTQEAAKSRAALESKVQQVMESHGMDQAALVKAWDDLTKMGHNADEITPEFLGTYYANTKKIDFIETKLQELNPELASDAKTVEQLATYAIQTEASEAEMAEVIAQLYGETPERKLSKKIEKNMKSNRQGGSKAVKNAGSDPLFFDDI
jgi:hypothetical protein